MATTTEDLQSQQGDARASGATIEAESLTAAGEPPVAGGTGTPDTGSGEATPEERPASVRLAIAIAFPVLACAVMVGGIFTGVSPRFYAAISGFMGLALAFGASRSKKPFLTYVSIIVGLFGIGAVMLFPDIGGMLEVHRLAAEASKTGDVLRPPVDFVAGWKPIVGWLMAIVGFTAGWIGFVVRWRAASLLLPLPVAAMACISVPDNAQVASGLALVVLFAIGLGLLSSEQAADDEESRPSAAYEIRKALKALPLTAAIVAVLYLLAQSGFLIPEPRINPAQEPQKPKTQPLSEVEDRVLFGVTSPTGLTGPFRMGSLDVYDGKDWRLPPFAENRVEEVSRSGVVDPDLEGGLEATITVAGLGGAVLPGLPNTVGVRARGPQLGYDSRNNNIRLLNGQATAGLTYTVVAAGVPSIDDLNAVTDPVPKEIEQFMEMPSAPPPAVQGLIDQAPDTSKWAQFDFVRTWILENVTAAGLGTPASVTPERVDDMIGGSKRGTPFELVAAQAMLARWIGIPARIGYGFDGGEKVGDVLEVRPKHGAAFVEVYFPGFKWLPVIGTPLKAEPTVGNDPSLQKQDPQIEPSEDIAVQLFLPIVIPPKSVVAQQIGVAVMIGVLVALFIFLVWVLWPAVRKARLRSRRRAAALAAGPRARVALAYAEWRDFATDLGFMYPTDTPLMFLDRFMPDDEHTELAWLTTRVLWGDLQDEVDAESASVAEELSRALRRRLAAAQPSTVRAVGTVSRLSLKNPYAPDTDLTKSRRVPKLRKERSREPVTA